ncbi:MAG TPA: hypothetical protein VLE70_06615 [Anaerolineae bacterium]|nr:hypothetical protein [Anaerolineae bacterium]
MRVIQALSATDVRIKRSLLLVLGFIIGLLGVACGGGSSAAVARGDLPGSEEFGLTKQELVSSIEAVEQNIASCMSEAGFEYIAADYNTVRKGMTSDKNLPGMSEERFIREYGYGISTFYTGQAPQLATGYSPAQVGLGERNIAIFESLSPADQVAYNHNLFGENSDATLAVALEIEDLSRTGGCTRTAIEQAFDPEQLLATYYNPKDALIEEDPRMIEAIAKYAECIHEAGFDYNHEKEIEADLRNRLATITGGAPIESLSADARAALTELQAYERALAVESLRCEEKYLEPAEDKVERELYSGRQQ